MGGVHDLTFEGVSPMADLRAKNGRKDPWKVDIFGVGNENWGCGGCMTPEHYANLYRQYQTYVRNYNADHPIKKVCGGPNVDDYHWTEKVLETCFDHTQPQLHGFMDYLSLHYYVHPDGWEKKGSATEFDETDWYKTLYKAIHMDTLLAGHSAIMDQYDPEKKIGLSVDEWGTWFSVEPSTNPGFLYQQSTMRDALVAGVTLDIFNRRSDRVKMTNIAQMVNVLQAVILTDGDRMLLTPTYHVFHMYRHHQGATLLQSDLSGVGRTGAGEWTVPEVSESVSQKDGMITITLNNLNPNAGQDVDIQFAEGPYQVTEAKIVTGKMRAYNTFDADPQVLEKDFKSYQAVNGCINVQLPPCSVVALRVK